MLRRVRLEREALYVDNGAIKAVWRDVLAQDDLYGRKVSHIVMPREESLQIKTPGDLELVARRLRGTA
jgi:CMP-N-acetylneuraminic acid synthetase